MIVEDIFDKIPFAEIISRPNTNISGVSIDSNQVEPGDLFIPLVGENYNGYKYINLAVQKGAAAIAGDEIKSRKNHVSCIFLPNAQRHLSSISSMVYGNPSKRLRVVGVTGTNGKTTTCHLIESFLKASGNKAGFIGSTAYRWAQSYQEAPLTTPASPALQRMFRKMIQAEVTDAVVECTSHGIDQRRLDHTHFDAAVFTNLTQDHMDYHGNFVSYRNAKWQLFSSLLENSNKRDKFAIFNLEDPVGRSWSREFLPSVKIVTYSIEPKSKADVFAESYKFYKDATVARIKILDQTLDISTPMIGKFNLQNILAGLATAHIFGLDLNKAKDVLAQGVYVPGRLEKMTNTGNFQVYIDFAHTDDALSQVLDILQMIKEKKIITVFGCGGGKDKSKRPRMGKIAAEKSDIVIVTSDNPRNEDPETILDEIFTGIDKNALPEKEILRISNRSEAIHHALSLAQKGDIVLIAGKGHETFQEIRNFRHPFEDRKTVKTWFQHP